MSSPISFLVQYEKTIIDAYNRNDGNPAKTWASLEKKLPELAKSMAFNTFKQYLSVFMAVNKELDKVRQKLVIQELGNLEHENNKLGQELQNATHRLDKVTQDKFEISQQLEDTIQKKTKLESEVHELKERLDKVRQSERIESPVIQKLDNKKTKRINGWSVQESKDGYFRCYRKIYSCTA